MMRSTYLLCAVLAASASPSLAQNNPGGAGTLVVRGSCSDLRIGGENQSKQCGRELANITLTDGTILFIFSTKDRLVAFSGDGGSVRPNPDGSASLPLQFVNIGPKSGVPDVARATGSCRFTDPFAGRATIQCSANSQFGKVRGSFRTDGNPPRPE